MMFKKPFYPCSFSKYSTGFPRFIVDGNVRENRSIKSDKEYFNFILLAFICRNL